MKITKEDMLRFMVIEWGYTQDLAERAVKRQLSPECLQALESPEGLEVDEKDPELHEIVAGIRKWRDWHIQLEV